MLVIKQAMGGTVGTVHNQSKIQIFPVTSKAMFCFGASCQGGIGCKETILFLPNYNCWLYHNAEDSVHPIMAS